MKRKETVIYISEDGKEFSSKDKCLDWEMQIILGTSRSDRIYFIDDFNINVIHNVNSLRTFIQDNPNFIDQVIKMEDG